MPLPSPTSAEIAVRNVARRGWCASLLERWRAGRQVRDLDALEPLDRKAVLHDAGLTEGDLAAVAHGDHVRALLPAALALHGIDRAALEDDRGDIMQDLARVCMHCRSARACARLLARGACAEHGRLCPNAPTMDSLG